MLPKKSNIIWAIALLAVLATAYWVYRANTVCLWGFVIPKQHLKQVLIYTDNGNSAYFVHNHDLVVKIAEEASRMERLNRIDSHFPPGPTYRPVTKLVIQRDDLSTYGGSFWQMGGSVFEDADGYYWVASDEMIHLLQDAVHDPQTTVFYSNSK